MKDIISPTYYYVGDTKVETEDEAKERQNVVVDVRDPKVFQPIPTVFKLFQKNNRNQNVEVVPNPHNLTLKYWSSDIVSKIVMSSNKYIHRGKKKERTKFVLLEEEESLSTSYDG